MSQDRDPFDRLPRFVDPEPDPVVMNAVIAQSRDAFARRQGHSRKAKGSSLSNWFTRPYGWLMASGAVAAVFAVVVVVMPDRMPTSPGSGDVVADRSVPSQPSSNQLSRGGEVVEPESGGTRMGMQPVPGGDQAPVAPVPQVVSSFDGDGIRVGTRLDAAGLEIYLPDISGEQTIDVQGVMPGEQVELLAAFAQPEQELIAVQFMVDDVRFWRIYHVVDGQYGRDPERSRLVSDADGRAEVERRLAAPQP